MDMYREVQEELFGGEEKKKHVPPKAPEAESREKVEQTVNCPECGEPLVFEGGCNICKSCGWSKCL